MPAVRGFTLVELLVVIAIMALLGIVSFSKLPTLKEDRDLKNAANELQSIIRTAQTNATTSVRCAQTGGGSTWSVEYAALSVNLSCPGNLIKTLTFSNNVKICKITYSGCSTTDNCTTSPFSAAGVSTSFAQLGGNITYTDARCSPAILQNSANMTITLGRTGSSAIQDVIVSKGGTIEIKQ